MQRFTVVLFALVALFAIVVPSSANTLPQVKRETNADRFARHLPPLPPTRRATAKRQRPSQTPVLRTGRLQARDHRGNGKGKPLGYVQNTAAGPNGLGDDPDSVLYVTFSSVDSSISFINPLFSGGSYYGALATSEIASGTNQAYVLLTDVPKGGSVFWSILPQTGELTAVWRNLDGSTDVVSIALDPATNTFALVFDIPHFLNAHPDWSPVGLFIV